ncbi:MAG: tetratricopeptide repeat protein [Chitinophagales bacterium]|nr:tetratricopeptide repeat protein [Chitinophagales bacterium]
MCNHSKIVIFVLTLLTGISCPVNAQQEGFEKKKQEAINDLKNYPAPDTARVNALVRVLNTAAYLKERKAVLPYLDEAFGISRKLNYTPGLAACYSNTAGYYKSSSDYTKALLYFDSAIYITGTIQEENLLNIKQWSLEQKGAIYFSQENYYTALDYFFESLKYLTPGREQRRSRIYTFITNIYIALNNLDKATEYAEKNIALAEKDSSVTENATIYFSYIDVCLAKKDLETANRYLDKLEPFMPEPGQVQVSFGYYLKRGRVSFIKQHYNTAYNYFKETYKYALEGGHSNSKSITLYYLSATALKIGEDEAAKKYALENLMLAETMQTRSSKIDALTNLANYYYKTGNKTKAFDLIQQIIQLKDSLAAETNIKQLKVLGAVYDAEKQQKQISQLQFEKEKQAVEVKHKSALNKIFIASIIILLILGYLGFINFKKGQQLAKQQQALQKQKISELEKDKQLLTIDAMLKGQEEERSRIAKDLHDGLGSLLSGTKLSFMNVKENLPLTPETSNQFDRSLSMLDNSIGDLRKVAQNLMPEALVKFGLQEAVRDFCDSIQTTTGIKIVFQQFGERRKLHSTAEMFIYRIIQELVNNAVKHAEASQIIVQLTMNNNKTGITVEDNGKGFDKNILAQAKGAGMANISYRVQYFNGTSDLVTSPGNGTSVNIELIA